MCSQGPKEQQNVGTAGRIRRSDGRGSFSSCGGRNERGLLRWALSRTLLRWPLSRTPQRAEEPPATGEPLQRRRHSLAQGTPPAGRLAQGLEERDAAGLGAPGGFAGRGRGFVSAPGWGAN